MFQKIEKHRANDASHDVHRTPLDIQDIPVKLLAIMVVGTSSPPMILVLLALKILQFLLSSSLKKGTLYFEIDLLIEKKQFLKQDTDSSIFTCAVHLTGKSSRLVGLYQGPCECLFLLPLAGCRVH